MTVHWKKSLYRILPMGLCIFSLISFIPILYQGFYENPALDCLFSIFGTMFPLQFVEQWAKRGSPIAVIEKLTKVIDVYAVFLLLFILGVLGRLLFHWNASGLTTQMFALLALPYAALHIACVILRNQHSC